MLTSAHMDGCSAMNSFCAGLRTGVQCCIIIPTRSIVLWNITLKKEKHLVNTLKQKTNVGLARKLREFAVKIFLIHIFLVL